MLPDVGMVQMYSKSANVNDLHGFCVDRLAPLFAWTGPPPCSYGFSARWFAMPFRDTLHHPYICPCFWRKRNFIIQFVCLFFVRFWRNNYGTEHHQTLGDYKVGLQKCPPRAEMARLAVPKEISFNFRFYCSRKTAILLISVP